MSNTSNLMPSADSAEKCAQFLGVSDPVCVGGKLVSDILAGAIQNVADAVLEAVGKAVAAMGTMWVHIGTPNLTAQRGGEPAPAIAAGASAGGSANLTTVLGYVMWISLAIAVMALMALGAIIAIRIRAGDGIASVGRIGLVLAAVVFMSSASALISGFLPKQPTEAGGAVLFLQSSLWWYMGAAAVLSVIIGAVRMVWEQRAEHGRELVKSLLTLVVVAGAGVSVVGLLVTAADSFAVWILDGSLKCKVAEANSACFGQNMVILLAMSNPKTTAGMGPMLVILLGLLAIISSFVQILLMVARGGMLVLLTGILPLSASFTNTEMGKGWFNKCLSWLVAFILYKPAAAVVYAAAFQLTGANVFKDDGSGVLSALTGLMLMLLALFAMPALMRFVTPMVGALAGGVSGAMASQAVSSMPTGASKEGRLGAGGARGADGRDGARGEQGHSGDGRRGPSGSSGSQSDSKRTQGASGGQATPVNTANAQASSAPPVASSASAGGGGAAPAAGGSSAGAAGGGSAAAGAAGGVGVAVVAAIKAGQAASDGIRLLGEQAIGEGTEPDGSQ